MLFIVYDQASIHYEHYGSFLRQEDISFQRASTLRITNHADCPPPSMMNFRWMEYCIAA